MFDFLKIFKKKKEESEEVEIELNNLEKWINEKKEEKFSRIKKKAEEIVKNLKDSHKELLEISKQLDKEKLTKDMDPRLERKVIDAKNNLVRRTSFVAKKFLEIKTNFEKWEDLIEYKKDIQEQSKKFGSSMYKIMGAANIGFKKEVSSVDNISKRIKKSIE